MGRDKALIELNGRPLIEHVASTLCSVFERVIVASGGRSDYDFLGLESFGDLYKDCGPLGGIHSGLVHATTPAVFVLSCDMPFVSEELVRHIASFRTDAFVRIPSQDGQLQPLCGWYEHRCLTEVVRHLEANRLRVLDVLRDLPSTIIPISASLSLYRENLFTNFNTPADVAGNPAVK